VDVERIDRVDDPLDLADGYFAPFEVQALRAQPPTLRRERFVLYWTLKEAYIKARGMGLALPLADFSFHVDENGPIRISFDGKLEDDARRWQFATFRPTDRHRLAIAVDRAGAAELQVCVRRTIPLGAQ
jgi:4'-phosphopantetheinyl transferase